jgi:glycosyltransferase involved in cell wall biosynthesis
MILSRILHLELGGGVGGSTRSLARQVSYSKRFQHMVLFEDEEAYSYCKQIEGVSAWLLNRNSKPSFQLAESSANDHVKKLYTRQYLFLLHVKVMVECLYWIPFVRKLIRRENVSLVQLNNGLMATPLNWATPWAAWLEGIPCVVRLRSFVTFSIVQKFLAAKVSMFIANSRATGKSYLEQGIPSDRIRVIHNCLPLEETAWEEDVAMKSELRIKDNEKVVGFVGRLVHWKGVHIFLEAACEVSKAVPNVKFLIVGGRDKSEPLYGESLLTMADKLGIQDKCLFVGFQKEVQRYISAMDILVHASILPEPLGNVILEGSVCGKPVVATDCGGVPEIVKEGVTGLLVPPRDAKEMARAIVYLLKNSGIAERMGRDGREHVLSNFSISRMVAETEALFNNLLNCKTHARRKYSPDMQTEKNAWYVRE